MKPILAAIVFAGCASGKVGATGDGAVGGQVDGMDYADGQLEAVPDGHPDAHVLDAHLPIPIDAHPDARPLDARPLDALVFEDACVPVITELLANPVFDLTPAGVSWNQTPIEATALPITSDGAFAAQSPPYKVWLGGFAGDDEGVASVTDLVYQDIVVPDNTTHLAITGYYVVGTNETTTTVVFDTGAIGLIQTNGTPIETVLSLTNLTDTGTTWKAFSHTFTSSLSGQTVRLRMTSTNDVTNATNFFFDTLSIKATHCP